MKIMIENYLHLFYYLLAALVFTFFMVPTTLDISTDWKLNKRLNNCLSIFRKSCVRRGEYLRGNDLHKLHEGRKKNLYGPFLWMGFNFLKATEPLRGGRLLFTTKFPERPDTHLIDLGRMNV